MMRSYRKIGSALPFLALSACLGGPVDEDDPDESLGLVEQAAVSTWFGPSLMVNGGANQCVDVGPPPYLERGPVFVYQCNSTFPQHFRPVQIEADVFELRAGNRCVDMTQGRFADGTPIQLYTCNRSSAQRFVLENNQLHAAADRRFVLDVPEGAADRTQLRLRQVDGSPGQKFYFGPTNHVQELNGGLFEVRGLAGKCLTSNGEAVLWSCEGETSQRLFMHEVEARTGVYKVTNAWGECLDVREKRFQNETVVQFYGCNGGDAQKFYFEKSGEITPVADPRFALDVRQGGTANGTPIQLFQRNNSAPQRWTIVPIKRTHRDRHTATGAQTGAGVIRHSSGKCFDFGNPQVDGGPLYLFECNGTAAQDFIVEPTTVRFEPNRPEGNWIRLRAGTKCVQTTGTTEGSALVLATCSEADTQKFWPALHTLKPYGAVGRALPRDGATADRTPIVVRNVSDQYLEWIEKEGAGLPPIPPFGQVNDIAATPTFTVRDRTLQETGYEVWWTSKSLRNLDYTPWQMLASTGALTGVGSILTYTPTLERNRDYFFWTRAKNRWGTSIGGHTSIRTAPPRAHEWFTFQDVGDRSFEISSSIGVESSSQTFSITQGSRTIRTITREASIDADGYFREKISGLTRGTEYCVTVTATNHWGTSDPVRKCVSTTGTPPSDPPPPEQYVDLSIPYFITTPALPAPGQQIEVQLRVCATGTKASGAFEAQVWLDGAHAHTWNVPSLAPSGCTQLAYTQAGLSAADHNFVATVDSQGVVIELSEGNNQSNLNVYPRF